MVTINISFQEGGLFFFWKVLFCPFKWNMVDCSAVNSRFSDPGTIIAGIGLTLVLLTEVDCGFKSTIDFCQQSECKPNTSNWCAERPFRGPRWREPQTRHGHWQRNWTSYFTERVLNITSIHSNADRDKNWLEKPRSTLLPISPHTKILK